MNAIIQAEGIGKKYILSHQRKESYYALRDVMADTAKRWGRKLLHPVASRREPDPTHEEFWALKDVSFEINEGDRVGIIGRNGAGKSTLLKILSRITEPTAGRVSIRGRVASLLEVGTGFHPELTGRENIFLNGAILGMSKSEIKRKFDEIVDFAEIEQFLDTPVKRYSSGMYVRLAFAVAAHLEPEILVVDEVLAVGDAQFQKKCLGKMNSVAKEGRTVIFVSHNMAAIKTLCLTAISLHQGKIVKSGHASMVVEEYLSRGYSTVTERTWTRPATEPGNEHFKLFAIKIRATDPEADNYTIRTQLRLEFNFELLLKEALFYVGFHLKTLAGECIFVSGSPPSRLSKGIYQYVCHIPGDLLNVGTYTIHVYFVRDSNIVLYEIENPIIFEIHDVTREEGAWMGDYPGAVRPKLLWDLEESRITNEHSR